jgi:hypothetical protein
MADNLNTLSLPEIKPLSRRHVMAEAAALTAMTGAAMAGVAVAATPDAMSIAAAEFSERCRTWHSDHEEVEQAYKDVSARSDEFGDFPTVPAVLAEPLVAIDGTDKLPGEQYSNGVPSLCWSVKDLQDIIDKKGFWHCHAQHDGDKVTTTSGIKLLPAGEIERAAEMLPIAVLHEQRRKDIFEHGRTVETLPNEMSSRLWQDAQTLFAVPATCLASLRHKVAIARKLELFDFEGDDVEDMAIANIMSDIEALAGEMQS